MAESLTTELQNQISDIWKNSKVATWPGGYNTYTDKQLQTAIDRNYIQYLLTFYFIQFEMQPL